MIKIGKKDSFVFVEKEVSGCVLTPNIKKLARFIIKLDEKTKLFLIFCRKRAINL